MRVDQLGQFNINSETFIENLFNMADGARTVSRAKITLQEFHKLFEYLAIFNRCHEKQTRVLGVPMDSIQVINELSPFIDPSAVKFDVGNLASKNLLGDRDEFYHLEECDGYSVYEFTQLQMKFRGNFRKDMTDNTSTLSSLRSEINLWDIISRIPNADGDIVHCDPLKDLPMFVRFDVAPLFEDAAYTTSVKVVLDLWTTQSWVKALTK